MAQNQNLEMKFTMKEKIQKHLVRGLLPIILAGSVLGVSGCATTGSAVQNNLGYEFLDSYGDYKIVRKDNDTYLEKLDGSESKRLTHTPDVYEDGYFVSRGKYIRYRETHGKSGRYFVISIDGDDSNRKEISLEEYLKLIGRKE